MTAPFADIPAVVLAGGLGTRLRSAVPDLPKPMADIDGQPFMAHLLRYLARNGVRRAVLSVGYMHEIIEEHFGGSFADIELRYAVESSPLGTGGAVRYAASVAGAERFFLLNGDSFFDVPLARLLRIHAQSQAAVTAALKPMRDFDRYGAVRIDDSGKILEFKEKQPCAEGLVNGGVYVVDRAVVSGTQGERFSFESAVLEPLAAAGRMASLVCDGYFVDIGVPDDYARARAELPRLRG